MAAGQSPRSDVALLECDMKEPAESEVWRITDAADLSSDCRLDRREEGVDEKIDKYTITVS